MAGQKRIRYGVDTYTGYVVSQNLLTGKIAIPIIDFDQMCPEDGFEIKSHLEAISPLQSVLSGMAIEWTSKVPLEKKNEHRAFWGMKPLKEKEVI